MKTRNEILGQFGTFFKESNQTTEDATINMLDLERMNDKKLTRIYNAFFN